MMSRFLAHSAYAPSGADYELLPFNFARLNDQEAVVTNMSGEMLVLPNITVNALINHTLPVKDPAYVSLRARHFLRAPNDKSPIDLLALKVRTAQALAFSKSVDGIRLVNLMMDNEVDISPRMIKIPKLDTDYVDEE